MGPAGFPVEDHLIGSPAEPKARILTRPYFLLASLTPVALAGDVDREIGVLESIAGRIGADCISIDFRPVIEGQL
jgi:hypothetical protein